MSTKRPPQPHYRVVQSAYVGIVEREASLLVAEGWIPTGGIADGGGDGPYMQALWLPRPTVDFVYIPTAELATTDHPEIGR